MLFLNFKKWLQSMQCRYFSKLLNMCICLFYVRVSMNRSIQISRNIFSYQFNFSYSYLFNKNNVLISAVIISIIKNKKISYFPKIFYSTEICNLLKLLFCPLLIILHTSKKIFFFMLPINL